MKLKIAFTREGAGEFNLGPFFNTDIRKILRLEKYRGRLFTDDLGDPREYLKNRVSAIDSLYFTLRRGKEVIGYGCLDPIVGKQAGTHFYKLWKRNVSEEDFVKVCKLTAYLAFEEIGLDRLFQVVVANNLRALKLLEMGGFRKEGVMRQTLYFNGSPCDAVIYGMLREEVI